MCYGTLAASTVAIDCIAALRVLGRRYTSSIDSSNHSQEDMGGPGPRTACSVRTHPTLGAAAGALRKRGRIDGRGARREVAATTQHSTIKHTGAVGCAKCCTVFATSGVLFLCLIGTLLTKQPSVAA